MKRNVNKNDLSKVKAANLKDLAKNVQGPQKFYSILLTASLWFLILAQAWRVLIRDGECGQRIVPIM